MGCDIHVVIEKKIEGKWVQIDVPDVFDYRSYGYFGFLANVRNYSAITPIDDPRGVPEDVKEQYKEIINDDNYHSFSWLSVEELLNYNYDQIIKDRRCTRRIGENYYSGACTCEIGEGLKFSLRDFLSVNFFENLKRLKDAKADRIVFWFDN